MTTDRDKILDEMIQWWINRKTETTHGGRIRFDRSSTTQATIRIPTKMYNDAMTIAHADPNIKNFSRFCEMLIWERLGMSDEYLKSSYQSKQVLDLPEKEDE